MSKEHRDDSDRERLAPSDDNESLSARMLSLIEIATVEERRKADKGQSVRGERRRRDDEAEPAKRAS